MRIKLLGILLLFAAGTARADTINHIEANAGWNNLVTFNTSFNWDVTTNALVPGSAETSSTGLGTFIADTAWFGPRFASWTDQFFNNIQINFGDHAQPESFNSEGTFAAFNIELFNANRGFYFSDNMTPSATYGSIVITDPPDTTQVPEPGTLTLTLTGLVGLFAAAWMVKTLRPPQLCDSACCGALGLITPRGGGTQAAPATNQK